MNSIAKYVAVVAGSLATGAALFAFSFATLDFIWTHFVVKDPKQVGLGDGVVVVGGGFVIGCTLGIAGLLFVLYKFWPTRVRKQS